MIRCVLATVVVVVPVACDKHDAPRPEPAPVVATSDEGPTLHFPKRADPDRRPIGSPLTLTGAHQDYPTPIAAGTDQIFFLEDPDRGPKAPINYALPPRSSLVWTTHAYCEVDALDVVCSPAPPAGALRSWRVGRIGRETTVAESVRGKQVDRTYVFLAGPDGTPYQRIKLDAGGRVESALLFPEPGRYSGRMRNGANALDGCGFMAYRLDAAGRSVGVSCLQWLGEPMRDTNGVASTRFVRDARGFTIEERRFGLDGKPIAATDGVSTVLHELDAQGRGMVERYRDGAGASIASTTRCHGRRTERDADGTVARTICLDAVDRPAAGATDITIEEHRTDARGCQIGVRYLDASGRAATDHNRVHGEDYEADWRCLMTSRTCVDTLDQPMPCGPGVPARRVDRLDLAGNIVAKRHYGADRQPSVDPDFSVFEVRQEWDDLGNLIGEACYEETGTPALCGNTGYHAKRNTYDDVGRELEERYFDTAGEPSTNVGTTVHRSRYDNYDHLFETRGYDENGKLMESMGSATRRNLYDTAHRKFGVIMLDRADRPAAYTGCYTGVQCPDESWHAARIVRRPDGTVEQNQYFDVRGQLVATTDCTQQQCFD